MYVLYLRCSVHILSTCVSVNKIYMYALKQNRYLLRKYIPLELVFFLAGSDKIEIFKHVLKMKFVFLISLKHCKRTNTRVRDNWPFSMRCIAMPTLYRACAPNKLSPKTWIFLLDLNVITFFYDLFVCSRSNVYYFFM